MRSSLRRSKARAKVGRLSSILLFKYLLVLSRRLPFNALLLQPPLWLKVQLPLILPPHPIAAPSHSGATIPSVSCKGKIVAPDTFVTSSERSSSFSLIENVHMGELIEDLMKTKVPPPAYCRIQELLTNVCVSFYCFIHSFYRIK